MFYAKTSLESTAKVGTLAPISNDLTMSQLIPMFLKYGQFELMFSQNTLTKYDECLKWVVRDIGDLKVTELSLFHFTELKQIITNRGCGTSRVASMVFSMKSFLKYCKDYLELPVMDYKKIRSPRFKRREVIYLTNEEIEQFVSAIKIENGPRAINSVRMDGLRFRVLVEVLLGTGMRISEALSLNRDMVDFEKAEAKIIGKGSKERTVFFSERSLDWVKRYLSLRTDNEPALFLTQQNTRLSKIDVPGFFKRYSKKAGITKKLTPHVLRHTCATNLLFNGCPINNVQVILGHDRLETTCRYYLGVDKTKAKEAHGNFLNYQLS